MRKVGMLIILFVLMAFVSYVGMSKVVIGSVKPFSGEYASWAAEYLLGEKLALEDLGAKIDEEKQEAVFNLLGETVVFKWYDNKSKKLISLGCIRRLARLGAIAILGSPASSLAIPEAEECEKRKIVFISGGSTNPKTTEGKKYAFRICFIDPFQGKVAAKFAVDRFHPKKVIVLVDIEEAYCKGLAIYFEKAIKKLDPSVKVVRKIYKGGKKTYKSIVKAVKAANPDFIYLPGYIDDAAVIIKELRDAGVTAPVMGGDAYDAPEEYYKKSGTPWDGVMFTCFWAPEAAKTPREKAFIERFRKKYGFTPSSSGAFGYDTMLAIVEAIKKAGSFDPDDIAKALEGLELEGVSGKAIIGKDHNAIRPAVIMVIKGTVPQYLTTVSP